MNIATVFEWFAQASAQLAEENNDPSQRERLLKLASLWAAAAQRSRNELADPLEYSLAHAKGQQRMPQEPDLL